MDETMFDYKAWLDRAVRFTKGLERLRGEIHIKVEVGPTISAEELHELARFCRLPIPVPLRRFWQEASANLRCGYDWFTPDELQEQLKLAFAGEQVSHLCGGPEFETAIEAIEATDMKNGLAGAFGLHDDFPEEARYSTLSIPFMSLGDGDHVALYVGDN